MTEQWGEQMSFFDPDLWCGKMYPEACPAPAKDTAAKTSRPSSTKSAKSSAKRKELAPTPKASRLRARTATPDAPCAICGKVGYTEVHHIDKNPMNNDPQNLVRLCKSCHAKQHREKSFCVVCGAPAKGHHLCSKHWQAWRKSNQRGWDTEYTAYIRECLQDFLYPQN